MHSLFQKTFGGLSTPYYFRQLFFSLIIAAFLIITGTQDGRSIPLRSLFFIMVSTLLYPYSRFVYESIAGFIIGNNVFFVNALVLLATKFITMLMCWTFALLVAPVGLLYLYFHHSREERVPVNPSELRENSSNDPLPGDNDRETA
jgi:predicted membrane protein